MPGSYAQLDWYETPQYYDLIFDVETADEADFLEAVFERYGTPIPPGRRPRALEPACGSGRLVRALARRGWSVHGLDLSKPMLDYARRRLVAEGVSRRARLQRADMADFEIPRPAHLAHCGVSTFKYLLSEAAARAHLRCVARSLVAGGIYALGLHLSDYEDRRRSVERWKIRREGLELHCAIEGWPADRRRRRERVRSRLRVIEGDQERRWETRWEFRTYDAPQLRRLLRSVPEFEHVATFDFTYDIARPRELEDDYLDKVVILRRGRD